MGSNAIAAFHRKILLSGLVVKTLQLGRRCNIQTLFLTTGTSHKPHINVNKLMKNYCCCGFNTRFSYPLHSTTNRTQIENNYRYLHIHRLCQCQHTEHRHFFAQKFIGAGICMNFGLANQIDKSQQKRYLYTVSQCSVDQQLVDKQLYASKLMIPKRFKSKKHVEKNDSSESDDSDEDEDIDEFMIDESFEEDYFAPTNFKQMKVYVHSHRLDSLISAGLNISRKKIDELFYASKLRVNDKKILKKSIKIMGGDCIDVITESKEDSYKVKRVRLMKTFDKWTDKNRTPVILRAWRASFDVPRTDTWNKKEEK